MFNAKSTASNTEMFKVWYSHWDLSEGNSIIFLTLAQPSDLPHWAIPWIYPTLSSNASGTSDFELGSGHISWSSPSLSISSFLTSEGLDILTSKGWLTADTQARLTAEDRLIHTWGLLRSTGSNKGWTSGAPDGMEASWGKCVTGLTANTGDQEPMKTEGWMWGWKQKTEHIWLQIALVKLVHWNGVSGMGKTASGIDGVGDSGARIYWWGAGWEGCGTAISSSIFLSIRSFNRVNQGGWVRRA